MTDATVLSRRGYEGSRRSCYQWRTLEQLKVDHSKDVQSAVVLDTGSRTVPSWRMLRGEQWPGTEGKTEEDTRCR